MHSGIPGRSWPQTKCLAHVLWSSCVNPSQPCSTEYFHLVVLLLSWCLSICQAAKWHFALSTLHPNVWEAFVLWKIIYCTPSTDVHVHSLSGNNENFNYIHCLDLLTIFAPDLWHKDHRLPMKKGWDWSLFFKIGEEQDHWTVFFKQYSLMKLLVCKWKALKCTQDKKKRFPIHQWFPLCLFGIFCSFLLPPIWSFALLAYTPHNGFPDSVFKSVGEQIKGLCRALTC